MRCHSTDTFHTHPSDCEPVCPVPPVARKWHDMSVPYKVSSSFVSRSISGHCEKYVAHEKCYGICKLNQSKLVRQNNFYYGSIFSLSFWKAHLALWHESHSLTHENINEQLKYLHTGDEDVSRIEMTRVSCGIDRTFGHLLHSSHQHISP